MSKKSETITMNKRTIWLGFLMIIITFAGAYGWVYSINLKRENTKLNSSVKKLEKEKTSYDAKSEVDAKKIKRLEECQSILMSNGTDLNSRWGKASCVAGY